MIDTNGDVMANLYRTKLNKLITAGLRIKVDGQFLIVYDPSSEDQISLPVTKKNKQFLEMKFPGLRQS